MQFMCSIDFCSSAGSVWKVFDFPLKLLLTVLSLTNLTTVCAPAAAAHFNTLH